jgi:hypothetical protein
MNPNIGEGVQEEVNKRMGKAADDLADKYAAGKQEAESSQDGPTGSAYKEKAAQEQAAKKAARTAKALAEAAMEEEEPEDLEEIEEQDDESNELRGIREARLRRIKEVHMKKLENQGKGHGQYREIEQDSFLTEVCSSDRVLVHFYHRDFQKCVIMDHHLAKLAHTHIETKFMKIDAEKTPFFVQKLSIRTMPTVMCFVDGIAVDKIIGFEGLAELMAEGLEDEWSTYMLACMLSDKRMINKSAIVNEDERNTARDNTLSNMRTAMMDNYAMEDDDDDFDDMDV